MMALDTFRMFKRLREAGFDERQTETVVQVLCEGRVPAPMGLMTKADLEQMRGDIMQWLGTYIVLGGTVLIMLVAKLL